MKSLTLDNILHPYEETHDICIDDNGNISINDGEVIIYLKKFVCCQDSNHEIKKENIKYVFDKEKRTFNKIKISNKTLLDNIKTKHYIKIGDECSICLAEIWNSKEGLLTDCGHGFHKKCINNYADTTCYNYSCPVCRNDIVHADHFSINTYNTKNYLDKIDDLWLNIDMIFPDRCSYSNWNHYLGMNKDCKNCLNYRKTGNKYLKIKL